MRKYDDPVDVRRGGDGPEQFLWHGRLWKVREVIAHWVETGAWWQAAVGAEGPVDLVAERELWRVEAGRGVASGVFDLALDSTDGHWQLVGCAD
ncbi:DUF6504 family protein [Nocardioides limicola]|uniref:DUF6504 family protein n=1 Tax=Nocardioides limicola TaxID=2803368 RepID=UPI00193C399A|nr:DUF6504 family protein [Nocardioides sp. DJM-14]